MHWSFKFTHKSFYVNKTALIRNIPREEGDECGEWEADVLQEEGEGAQSGDLLLQQGHEAVDGQQQKTLKRQMLLRKTFHTNNSVFLR